MTDLPERPGPMPCPFRPCKANLRPLIHRLDPYDVSKIAIVYPIHDVEGEASWFGRCPASQFVVPKLSARALQHLADVTASYERRKHERERLASMFAAIERARIELDPQLPWHQRRVEPGVAIDPPGGSVGRPQRLPADDYFPGRPADAPEPGTGEEPAAPPPPTVDGEPLGRAGDMSNSRAETKSMLAAAAQAGTETQAGAEIVLERLDAIDAAIAGMADNQQIAGAMMVAAIGTDGDAPEDAVAALAAASRVGELLNEMRESAAELRMRAEGAKRVAGRIAHHATEYSNSF